MVILLGAENPQAFRQYTADPSRAGKVADAAVQAARIRADRVDGPLAWAVHLSHDRSRVITLETWADASRFREHQARADRMAGRESSGSGQDTALYVRAGTGGLDPTPVGDPALGVVVIDIFRMWRPLIRPVSAFNLRNGEAFNRQPGCVSTTVLRGTTAGRIATYARWRTTEDFLAAFTATQGTTVRSTDDVNAAAARLSRGLIRTDYHAYDVIAMDEGAPPPDQQEKEDRT